MISNNLKIIWEKKKSLILILSFAFLVFLIHIIMTINYINSWKNLIYPGIYIKDIDVGGMNKEEARELINSSYIYKIENMEINLSYIEGDLNIRLNKLKLNTNIELALDEAINYKNKLSFFEKLEVLKKPQKVHIKLKVEIDQKDLDDVIKDLKKKIDKFPVDATLKFNRNMFSIIKEEDGIEVNKEEFIRILESSIENFYSDSISIEIPVLKISARITENMLKQINGVISYYSTNLGNSQEGRINNIQKGIESINGMVLLPGEVFSFNDIIGDTTMERGYSPAPVILEGKLEQGYGGGICQVSSTLYGAILRANIQPMKRQHHSFPVNYVPEGLDATIVYGIIDFKFKNIYDAPLYISCYVKDNNVAFKIYSNTKILNKKSYDFYSKNKEIIEANTIYIDDPNLEEGTYEIRVKPRNGVSCDVYRLTMDENGHIIEDKFLHHDIYSPIDEVIAKGIRKKSR